MDEEWDVLASLLPERWRDLARETGAMRRARGAIRSPDQLLRVLLMHTGAGLSLRHTVARARERGLVSMSEVALFKRLRTSGNWLGELGKRMLQDPRDLLPTPTAPGGRRLLAVDATSVPRSGASGDYWRVHYVISLPQMRCEFVDVTDTTQAESYKRVPVQPGDLILADRGYCHREGAAHVLDAGGDVLMRLHSTGFPLIDPDSDLDDGSDHAFDLLEHLEASATYEPRQWRVEFQARDQRFDARVCALRKSREAAELAKRKILQRASKSQRTVRPQTLRFAEFVMVLTSVPENELSAAETLELYRARWQIELHFKRLKSLLRLGTLPKSDDDSARAWIQGKLLTALLIEALTREALFFSPWGHRLAPPLRMA